LKSRSFQKLKFSAPQRNITYLIFKAYVNVDVDDVDVDRIYDRTLLNNFRHVMTV